MTENPSTFPDPDIPTTIPDSGIERPKTDDMTYPKKKKIDEAIFQNTRKKDVYELDMHNIYNLVVGQINEKPQEKAVSDANFQVDKTDQDPIGYLMILKRL